MKLIPKKYRKRIEVFGTFFFGVTTAYFVWLSWDKLTVYIGDANKVWLISGGIVIFGIVTGYLSVRKLAERFT